MCQSIEFSDHWELFSLHADQKNKQLWVNYIDVNTQFNNIVVYDIGDTLTIHTSIELDAKDDFIIRICPTISGNYLLGTSETNLYAVNLKTKEKELIVESQENLRDLSIQKKGDKEIIILFYLKKPALYTMKETSSGLNVEKKWCETHDMCVIMRIWQNLNKYA